MTTTVLDSPTQRVLPDGVSLPQRAADYAAPLSSELCSLLADCHRALENERQKLLALRTERKLSWDTGTLPTYLDQENPAITENWRVKAIPADLQCRRVEITGPVNSAKMVINMLSRNGAGARADCAMLDFEDSMKPSWKNVIDGIDCVIGAVRGDLSFTDPNSGKHYALDNQDKAKVMVRVRGLHLAESNFLVDDQPISAGLFDLVATAYHTAAYQVARGETPKYYVPKVEDYLEARWWETAFSMVEQRLGLPQGSMRATFLIETLPAAFQIEEILYELRHHVAGLNVGRWDKIFSDIKVVRNHPDRIMADRGAIDMKCDWMANYAQRLIRICHRRGAYALGGMAAFTPGKSEELRAVQTHKVVADKTMEASWGHDGCWVSHPFFIGPAMEAFKRKNQLDVIPPEEFQTPDLLPKAQGPRTMNGLRTNIRVGIAYMHGWLADIGCIAWDNLMEDLATLEISRAQVWQWLHHRVALDCDTIVTPYLVDGLFDLELQKILSELGESADVPEWEKAAQCARELFLQEVFQDFLSLKSDPA